jgi:DNA-binding NarL/FixJ family response regulator
MPVRILIADDSEIFRKGLRAMIEGEPGWEVCGEAVDGVQAIQKTRQLTPDLIVMDLAMPQMSGLDATREILKEFPKIPIVLLTLYLTRQLNEDARNIGIRATVSKTTMDRLPDGIHAALRIQ